MGCSFPSPGYLPEPGVEPGSPTLQADSLPSEPPGNYRCRSQSPNLSPPHSPVGIHMFVLYICVSISTLKIGSPVLSFLDSIYVCYYMRYQKSQIHRVRKYSGRCPGMGGVLVARGTWCLEGTEYQFRKVNNSGDG